MNIVLLKNIVLYFKKCNPSFEPLFVSDKNLAVVQNAKILGLSISNNLTWNTHIGGIITKANKRMYFLVLLRKAGVPLLDIANFYCTCVRPYLNTVRPCSPTPYQVISARISREFKSTRLMLFLQGTVIAIILLALAWKLYRIDVNHYVLNSFNQFYVKAF